MQSSWSIPFHKPHICGRELQFLQQAVQQAGVASDGQFTRKCTEILEQQFSIGKVLMTSSCTAALEIAALLCDLGPGDEVIMPSFSFVTTATAFARTGATPVFVDIRADTLNLDESRVADAVTSRTKAIVAMHYAGVGCNMAQLDQIARKHDLLLIEDAAQGVNAFCDGRALGSIGHLGAYSFHSTKNFICGEGGALCINSTPFVERAEVIRDKGTNRARFFRGEVDKYTWVDMGSSYAPSELACAFLYAQLLEMSPTTRRFREVYHYYEQQLQPWHDAGLLQMPHIPGHCKANYHMFYILLPDPSTRDALLAQLRSQGIQATFHFVPLHESPMGKKLCRTMGDLAVTRSMSRRLLRLPYYHQIATADQQRVVESIRQFLTSCG